LILCESIIHQIGFSCNKKNRKKIVPESAFRRYSNAAEMKNMAAKGLFVLNKFFYLTQKRQIWYKYNG